jgi:hypothetical protein
LGESYQSLCDFHDGSDVLPFKGIPQVVLEGDLAGCMLLRDRDDFDGVLM